MAEPLKNHFGSEIPGKIARMITAVYPEFPADASFSLRLAERVAFTLDLGRFPLVLGGDCSILLGPSLALRQRGRFGLFFLDGHADFYSPASELSGEVASMDLAIVTGHGPAALTDLDGRRPLVREDDVVLFGFRDADVLNDEVMPAVDYRMPDGLWPDELTEALKTILASPLAVGMEVTIYNPAFDDAERSAARTLAQAVTAAFVSATYTQHSS